MPDCLRWSYLADAHLDGLSGDAELDLHHRRHPAIVPHLNTHKLRLDLGIVSVHYLSTHKMRQAWTQGI